MLHAVVHAADIQDRDGGALVMATLFGLFPFLGKLYADGGDQGAKFQTAVKRAINQLNVEIVKRSDAARGFLVLPKRAALIFTLTEADDQQPTGLVEIDRVAASLVVGARPIWPDGSKRSRLPSAG
jgi:hypothetical protein